MESLLQKVPFVSKITMLLKATSDDDSQTPGYMFPEISKLTFESGTYCQDLLDFLLGQLASSSCRVKIKTLKIIHYLIDTGHPSVVTILRKKSTAITEAARCGGPPDPVLGVSQYQMVRQEAQEILKVLFTMEEDDQRLQARLDQPPKAYTSMSGMGSSSMATSGMAGFGNAPIKQSKSLGETIFASLRSWTDSKLIQNSSSSAAAYPMSYGNYRAISLEAPPLEGSKPQPAAFSGTLSPAATRAVTPPSAARPASAKRTVKYKRGVAGGGWGDPSDADQLSSSQSKTSVDDASSESNRLETVERSCSSQSSHEVLFKIFNEGAMLPAEETTPTPEWTLVDEFVTRSDRMPRRDELKTFLNKCTGLSLSAVILRVAHHLLTTNTAHMRCLMIVETFLYQDIVPVDELSAAVSKSIEHLLSTLPDGASKTKTQKISLIFHHLLPSSEQSSHEHTEQQECDSDGLAKSSANCSEMLTDNLLVFNSET